MMVLRRGTVISAPSPWPAFDGSPDKRINIFAGGAGGSSSSNGCPRGPANPAESSVASRASQGNRLGVSPIRYLADRPLLARLHALGTNLSTLAVCVHLLPSQSSASTPLLGTGTVALHKCWHSQLTSGERQRDFSPRIAEVLTRSIGLRQRWAAGVELLLVDHKDSLFACGICTQRNSARQHRRDPGSCACNVSSKRV